jgi:hypothetical protein
MRDEWAEVGGECSGRTNAKYPILRPFDKPFDRLKAASMVERLRVVSMVEPQAQGGHPTLNIQLSGERHGGVASAPLSAGKPPP